MKLLCLIFISLAGPVASGSTAVPLDSVKQTEGKNALKITSSFDYVLRRNDPKTVKTFLVDCDFVQKYALDLGSFLNNQKQVCFVGDSVEAQKVISAIFAFDSKNAHTLPGRIDIEIDHVHPAFQYEHLASYQVAEINLARCK